MRLQGTGDRRPMMILIVVAAIVILAALAYFLFLAPR